MTTYIVLLRGVMPTGRNKVPMARLREVLTDAGFKQVRTYIQSGNALVGTDLSLDEVGHRVRESIKSHIGPDLVVVVRTGAQLQAVLDDSPFRDGHDRSRVFYVSFAESPPSHRVAALAGEDFGDDKLAITNDTAYLYIPGAYGRGRLSGTFLEKRLGIAATMRNFNTMSALIALSKAD
jgi:uncharacterized protein (DUF1697 family)